tara:strand:+ start:855 stop:2513 length:1659 start_codon:yes stop_codon:yes gene_type:complete
MIDEFIKIFEGLDRAYGQFKRNDSRISLKVEGKPWVEHKPLQRNLWENHLRGIGVSLGVFPLTDNGTCKWGAIDIDDESLDYEELLKKIRKLKLPLIMFRSKSGRAHVYMFMKEFTSAEEVKLVMKKFASKLGLADKLDRIYPMQTELGKKETGSWLNLPYFNHEEGSRYAYKDDFDAATVEEFFEMHKQYVQESLDEYLVEEIKLPTKKVKHTSLEDLFLPCQQNSLRLNNNKIPTTIGRNDFLLHSYTWAKRAQTHAKKIEEYKHLDSKGLLKHFNKKYLKEPLPEAEIEKTIFKSEDKEYKYLCSRPNIKKYCEPSACTRHLCGITPDQALELVGAEEALGQITEHCSEPPIFYESVDVKKSDKGGHKRIRIEMDGSFFLYKDKYLTRLANAGYFPHDSILNMKSTEFRRMNLARLAKRNYEKAAAESTPEHEFRALMHDFLSKCTVSVISSHLLDGACYYNEETKEMDIRIHKLMEYLKANRDFRPIRKIAFDLKHLLKAEKINGKVKDTFGKDKSCPTWRFKEDRENFIITLAPGQQQIENKKNEED